MCSVTSANGDRHSLLVESSPHSLRPRLVLPGPARRSSSKISPRNLGSPQQLLRAPKGMPGPAIRCRRFLSTTPPRGPQRAMEVGNLGSNSSRLFEKDQWHLRPEPDYTT